MYKKQFVHRLHLLPAIVKRGVSNILSKTTFRRIFPNHLTTEKPVARKYILLRHSDAGTVETQPSKPHYNVEVAARVSPYSRHPGSFMDDANSELSSDNDSKHPAKNADTKRPARKKPFTLDKGHAFTHSATVGQPSEKEADEESSGSDFQADADDYDDDEDMVSDVGVADDEDSGRLTSHRRIRNQNVLPPNLRLIIFRVGHRCVM